MSSLCRCKHPQDAYSGCFSILMQPSMRQQRVWLTNMTSKTMVLVFGITVFVVLATWIFELGSVTWLAGSRYEPQMQRPLGSIFYRTETCEYCGDNDTTLLLASRSVVFEQGSRDLMAGSSSFTPSLTMCWLYCQTSPRHPRLRCSGSDKYKLRKASLHLSAGKRGGVYETRTFFPDQRLFLLWGVDQISSWSVNITFFDPTEYNSAPGFVLECTDQRESSIFVLWVFCAICAGLTVVLGLVKVVWYTWVAWRHGRGANLQGLQLWNAKLLVAATCSSVLQGLYSYAKTQSNKTYLMCFGTLAQGFFSYCILSGLGSYLTGFRSFLMKVTAPVGFVAFRLSMFFYYIKVLDGWSDPFGLSTNDFDTYTTIQLYLIGLFIYLLYGWCLLKLCSQTSRELQTKDYMIEREVPARPTHTRQVVLCHRFVQQLSFCFWVIFGVCHLITANAVSWAASPVSEWFSFSLWLQHTDVGYDFAQVLYMSLFTWVATLLLSPRHHSSVSRDVNLMEVPWSTWSQFCRQTRAAIESLNQHLSQETVPVAGYRSTRELCSFDLVLARLLARCSSGVYCNLYAGQQGGFRCDAHAIFDTRDQLSMVARAPGTKVCEMVTAPETDTNAAVFEQVYEPTEEPSSGCEVTRVIVAFRGTLSGANLRTDMDTAQVRFDGDCWVHKGFANALESISEELVQRLIEITAPLPKPVELCVCGHSLGGALAGLFSLVVAREKRLQVRVRCYTFGQPRVGDSRLSALIDELVPDYWRVAHRGDPVCRVPGVVNLKSLRQHCGSRRYKHAGHMVQLQTGGQLVFSPTPVETFLENTNVFNHSLGRYEDTLELCLRNRRRWLWRKALVAVRVVVRLMLSARACQTRRSRPESFSLEVKGGPPGSSGARNPLFRAGKCDQDEPMPTVIL